MIVLYRYCMIMPETPSARSPDQTPPTEDKVAPASSGGVVVAAGADSVTVTDAVETFVVVWAEVELAVFEGVDSTTVVVITVVELSEVVVVVLVAVADVLEVVEADSEVVEAAPLVEVGLEITLISLPKNS